MSTKKFDEMSKAERIALILEDSQAYLDIVPGEQLLGILDGIAKTGPIEKSHDQESNPA